MTTDKPLSTSSPEAVVAAAMVTPQLLSELLARSGPLAIRHITHALTDPGLQQAVVLEAAAADHGRHGRGGPPQQRRVREDRVGPVDREARAPGPGLRPGAQGDKHKQR